MNAGAGDVVRIRGMIIKQAGSSDAGILFASGAALHVENCTLVGTAAGGPAALYFAPTTAASGGVPTELSVRNSTISGNPAGNVLIKPSAGVAVAALFENTLMAEGLYGIRADNSAGSGMIRVDVRNSVAKGNSNNGFLAVGTGASPIHFMIDHSTAENNGVNGADCHGRASVHDRHEFNLDGQRHRICAAVGCNRRLDRHQHHQLQHHQHQRDDHAYCAEISCFW